jgi:hypothetical protein
MTAKTFKEIRQQHDLVAVIAEATRLTKSGREWRGDCIFGHTKVRNNDLTVFYDHRARTWRFHCKGAHCGVFGDVVDFVRMMLNKENPSSVTLDQIGAYLNDPAIRNRQKVARAAAEPVINAPLEVNVAMQFHNQLLNNMRAVQWWQSEGIKPQTIRDFKLGYCARCPTYPRSDSYTIPVYSGGELVTIRHRLANPSDPGDKYRPQRAGDASHIFNYDVLRPDHEDILIVAGEKKALVLHQELTPDIIPVISATAGAGNWYGQYATIWPLLLRRHKRIYVAFDPGEEDAAEQTAALFGRRGYIVRLDEKPDDLILRSDLGTKQLLDAIGAAIPVFC